MLNYRPKHVWFPIEETECCSLWLVKISFENIAFFSLFDFYCINTMKTKVEFLSIYYFSILDINISFSLFLFIYLSIFLSFYPRLKWLKLYLEWKLLIFSKRVAAKFHNYFFSKWFSNKTFSEKNYIYKISVNE